MASPLAQKIASNFNLRSFRDLIKGGPQVWKGVLDRIKLELSSDNLDAAVSLAMPLAGVKELAEVSEVYFNEVRFAKVFKYSLLSVPRGIFAGSLYGNLRGNVDDTKSLFIAGPTSDSSSGKLNNGIEGASISDQHIEPHKGGVVLDPRTLLANRIFLKNEERDPRRNLYVGTSISFEIDASDLKNLSDMEILAQAVDICVANGYIGSYNTVQGFLLVDSASAWQYINTVTPLTVGSTLSYLLESYIAKEYTDWHDDHTGYSVIWAVYVLLSSLKDTSGNIRVVLLEEGSVSVPVTMVKRNLPLYFYV